jgi:hypothetical protein
VIIIMKIIAIIEKNTGEKRLKAYKSVFIAAGNGNMLGLPEWPDEMPKARPCPDSREIHKQYV